MTTSVLSPPPPPSSSASYYSLRVIGKPVESLVLALLDGIMMCVKKSGLRENFREIGLFSQKVVENIQRKKKKKGSLESNFGKIIIELLRLELRGRGKKISNLPGTCPGWKEYLHPAREP